MVIALQILSQILQTKDISILESNQLTVDYFPGYEEEYNFIMNHYREYGNVPDKVSFHAQFQDFEIVDVTESEQYLVDTIREEHLYADCVPVVQNVAKLMKTNSNAAVEYLVEALKDLKPNYRIGGTDIIKNAKDRLQAYLDRRDNQENWFFTTGFPELDDIIHGINRKEEFMLFFARPNQGKSWTIQKVLTHIWELGQNVGYISPEMGELSVGYRFDTIHHNVSNTALMWGKDSLDDKEYAEYIDDLSDKPNKFIVATPLDFNNRITISKLRQFIKQYNLQALAIDGITYLSDERGKRNDNKTTSLTNISQDLKSLGMELEVPIILVIQANRGGAIDKDSEDLPELEAIRDSDGPAQVATIVIAIKQGPDGVLTYQIKKQRNGRVGDKISYRWNPDIGEFISENGSITNAERPKRKVETKEDVF